MIKIKKTPQSIIFYKDEYSLQVRKGKDGIEFHQRVDHKDVKDVLKSQQLIVGLINREATKTNYQKRFSKLTTALSELGNIASFRVLRNKLEVLSNVA